jgi:hypothetical protein
LTDLGSESETCVGSLVHLVGVPISFEKKMDLWCVSTGDPYLMEKNRDEILMFAREGPKLVAREGVVNGSW